MEEKISNEQLQDSKNNSEENSSNYLLKSMFFKGTNIDVIKTNVNGNVRYSKLILDDKHNISLGGDVLFRSGNNILIRLKIENTDKTERIYELYNRKDKVSKQILYKDVIKYLNENGFIEISEKEYKLLQIPSI